eukprot:Tbor_TRINITY_DN5184_c2_g3::TRINITY_DN5184_c2_g3_i6::g.25861::m.25861
MMMSNTQRMLNYGDSLLFVFFVEITFGISLDFSLFVLYCKMMMLFNLAQLIRLAGKHDRRVGAESQLNSSHITSNHGNIGFRIKNFFCFREFNESSSSALEREMYYCRSRTKIFALMVLLMRIYYVYLDPGAFGGTQVSAEAPLQGEGVSYNALSMLYISTQVATAKLISFSAGIQLPLSFLSYGGTIFIHDIITCLLYYFITLSVDAAVNGGRSRNGLLRLEISQTSSVDESK